MSDKKTFTGKLSKKPSLSEEELAAMEVSEEKRLRESGIDPNGDPIGIMVEVRRQYMALKEAEAKETADKKDD